MGWVRCGLGTDNSILNLPTTNTVSGSIAQFNTDLTENLLSAVAEFSATQASGTPTPSAPIPIVGVDKVNFTRTGKNLLKKDIVYYNSNLNTLENCFFIKKGSYIVSFGSISNATSWRFSIAIKDKSGNNLTTSEYSPATGFANTGNRWRYGANQTTKSQVFNFAEDCYIRIFLELGDTSSSTVVSNGQLELGSTETDFEPYNGTTALINLGGTYYGGSVDAVTGKITLTHQVISYTGSADENWSIINEGDTNQRFRLNPAYSGMSLVTCSHCQLTNTNTANWGYCRFANNYFLLTDSDNQMGSVANLKTWLATQYANGTPLSILVELATPLVVYASNTAEIPTIVGDNNCFCNTGNITVKYNETVAHHIE